MAGEAALGRSLLHISDLHFGPPHLERVARGVLDLIGERRPDAVVVSGDLTQRAKPGQFRAARRFVDTIPAPTLVVPGNHDVPLYRFWERIFDPFGAYRRHFSPELEPVHTDAELFVLGINTAFNWTLKNGRITRGQLRRAAAMLENAPPRTCRIVVAHHHLIPPPNFGSQRVVRNARRAIDLFTDVGVELVLSGHQHQTYIGSSEEFYPRGRPPVVIVHAGTTTSDRGRAGERAKNSCNWIEIDSETLRVSHLRWHPELERFLVHSRHLYPRPHRVPFSLEERRDSAAAMDPVETRKVRSRE